jgi:hypothetical protein
MGQWSPGRGALTTVGGECLSPEKARRQLDVPIALIANAMRGARQ